MRLPKIFVICGSTRAASSNLNLIKAIEKLFSSECEFEIFTGLSKLPHFNPDEDTDQPPQTVINFRQKIRGADAVLICTPEYAMGVPGTLKNAIDWTVSSMEFSRKPVALITASSMGEKAHASLIETLLIIEAEMPETARLLISHIKTKVNSEGKILDPNVEQQVMSVMNWLVQQIKSISNK